MRYEYFRACIKKMLENCEAHCTKPPGGGRSNPCIVYVAAGPHYSFWGTSWSETSLIQVWDTWWNRNPPFGSASTPPGAAGRGTQRLHAGALADDVWLGVLIGILERAPSWSRLAAPLGVHERIAVPAETCALWG